MHGHGHTAYGTPWFPQPLELLHRGGRPLGAFEMACVVAVLACLVAGLDFCSFGEREFTLLRDALERTFVLGACSQATLVLIALCTACLDLLPGCLLRQILIK